MNSAEEVRVIEALEACTGGLTVTEHDLLSATDRFRKNVEPRSPRRRLALVVTAAVAALAAGVTAFVVADRNDAAPPVDTVPPALAEELGNAPAVV